MLSRIAARRFSLRAVQDLGFGGYIETLDLKEEVNDLEWNNFLNAIKENGADFPVEKYNGFFAKKTEEPEERIKNCLHVLKYMKEKEITNFEPYLAVERLLFDKLDTITNSQDMLDLIKYFIINKEGSGPFLNKIFRRFRDLS